MTASTFQTALVFTLSQEGGWSDNPADPGGATNKGITLRTLQAFQHGATVDDLRHIPSATVEMIYQRDYWWPVDGDNLPAGVDLSVFDFGVNVGPRRSVEMLQSALGVAVDGDIGPLTYTALANSDVPTLLGNLRNSQQAYYAGLDDFVTFGRGWTNRTKARYAAALAADRAWQGKTT
jgi:lysozyme family protein